MYQVPVTFCPTFFFCIVSSWRLDSFWPKFYLYIILIHLETILSSLLEKCARNRFPQELHYNCPPKLAAGERYICSLSNNARHRSDSRSGDFNSFTAAKWAFKLLHRVAHFIYLHSSIHQYILVYIDIYVFIYLPIAIYKRNIHWYMQTTVKSGSLHWSWNFFSFVFFEWIFTFSSQVLRISPSPKKILSLMTTRSCLQLVSNPSQVGPLQKLLLRISFQICKIQMKNTTNAWT